MNYDRVLDVVNDYRETVGYDRIAPCRTIWSYLVGDIVALSQVLCLVWCLMFQGPKLVASIILCWNYIIAAVGLILYTTANLVFRIVPYEMELTTAVSDVEFAQRYMVFRYDATKIMIMVLSYCILGLLYAYGWVFHSIVLAILMIGGYTLHYSARLVWIRRIEMAFKDRGIDQ